MKRKKCAQCVGARRGVRECGICERRMGEQRGDWRLGPSTLGDSVRLKASEIRDSRETKLPRVFTLSPRFFQGFSHSGLECDSCGSVGRTSWASCETASTQRLSQRQRSKEAFSSTTTLLAYALRGHADTLTISAGRSATIARTSMHVAPTLLSSCLVCRFPISPAAERSPEIQKGPES
jgi:hypothetical protein